MRNIPITKSRWPITRAVTGSYLTARAVADSTRTLLMTESGCPRVHYFPLADVRMDRMRPSERHTHCPFKGKASYWHVTVGGKTAEHAVWAYRDPYDEVARIGDHVAFDMNRMDEIRFGG